MPRAARHLLLAAASLAALPVAAQRPATAAGGPVAAGPVTAFVGATLVNPACSSCCLRSRHVAGRAGEPSASSNMS